MAIESVHDLVEQRILSSNRKGSSCAVESEVSAPRSSSPFLWPQKSRRPRDVHLRFTVSLHRKDQGGHGVAISRRLAPGLKGYAKRSESWAGTWLKFTPPILWPIIVQQSPKRLSDPSSKLGKVCIGIPRYPVFQWISGGFIPVLLGMVMVWCVLVIHHQIWFGHWWSTWCLFWAWGNMGFPNSTTQQNTLE